MKKSFETQTRQQDHRNKQGIIVATVSLLVNSLLVIFKYWIGFQLSSVAILAEAWHGLSDSLTSIMVIVGFKMASKPPDKKHPFGHGRIEVISSLMIAIILFIVAFNFLTESATRLIQKQTVQYNQIALFIFLLSLILKELLARYSIYVGRKIHSDSLVADGWHHRSDAFASLIVFIGVFLNPYFWWIDGAVGLVVSLIIAKIAYDILIETVSILIGEKPEESFIRQLESLIQKNYDQDIQFHHIHLHKYGSHRELTLHIVLPGHMKLKEAHKIATELEGRIQSELSVEATIHMESQDEQ